eukprot:5248269-Pyramimonas_sp.AAC.1
MALFANASLIRRCSPWQMRALQTKAPLRASVQKMRRISRRFNFVFGHVQRYPSHPWWSAAEELGPWGWPRKSGTR